MGLPNPITWIGGGLKDMVSGMAGDFKDAILGYIKPDMKQIAVAITHGFEGYIQDGVSRGLQHLEDSMGELGKNIGAKDFSPYGSINYWDEIYSYQKDVNRQLGIAGDLGLNMEQNFKNSLTTATRLGVEFKDVAATYKEFIQDVGINQALTSTQLEKMIEIQAVFGASAAKIFTSYDVLGVSIEDTSESLSKLVVESDKIGLNSQQVMEKLKQNIGFINTLHFREGRKGLEEMAKYAIQTKISMESVNRLTEGILDKGIEGAIEMASELQLLGGGFATMGDAFQIFEKARNSPQEFAKDIQLAASELSVFNRETGEFDIDALGMDKLRTAAKLLSQDVGELSMSTKKMAQETAIGNLFDSSIRGAADFDEILTKVSGAAKWNKQTQTFEVVVGNQKQSISDLNLSEIRQMGSIAQGTAQQDVYSATVTQNESLGEHLERFIKELKLIAISDKSYQVLDKFSVKMTDDLQTGMLNGFAEGFRTLGDNAALNFETTLSALSAVMETPSSENVWALGGAAWTNLSETLKGVLMPIVDMITPNFIKSPDTRFEDAFTPKSERQTPTESSSSWMNPLSWFGETDTSTTTGLPNLDSKQLSINKVLNAEKLLTDTKKDSGNSTTRTIIFEMPDGSKKTETFTAKEWEQLRQYVVKFNTGAGSDGYSYK